MLEPQCPCAIVSLSEASPAEFLRLVDLEGVEPVMVQANEGGHLTLLPSPGSRQCAGCQEGLFSGVNRYFSMFLWFLRGTQGYEEELPLG